MGTEFDRGGVPGAYLGHPGAALIPAVLQRAASEMPRPGKIG
jgi:hypothetical protein